MSCADFAFSALHCNALNYFRRNSNVLPRLRIGRKWPRASTGRLEACQCKTTHLSEIIGWGLITSNIFHTVYRHETRNRAILTCVQIRMFHIIHLLTYQLIFIDANAVVNAQRNLCKNASNSTETLRHKIDNSQLTNFIPRLLCCSPHSRSNQRGTGWIHPRDITLHFCTCRRRFPAVTTALPDFSLLLQPSTTHTHTQVYIPTRYDTTSVS